MAEPQPTTLQPQRSPIDWRSLRLWQIQPLRDAAVILAVIGVLYIGKLLSVVTVPILLAMLLAYLFEPLVQRMTRSRWMSRQGAAIAIIVACAILIVVPVVFGAAFATIQGAAFVQRTFQNVMILADVVSKPKDGDALQQLPGQTWRRLAEKLIELRAEAEQARIEGAGPITPPTVAPPGETPPVPAPDNGTPPDAQPPDPTAEPLDVAAGDAPTAAQPAPDSAAQSRNRANPLNVQLYHSIEAALQWVKSNAQSVGRQALLTGVTALELVARWLLAFGYLIFGAFLTAFFFYFFCTGYGRVLAFWENLIPERKKGTVITLVRQMDVVISGFVRGRLTIGVIMVLYYTFAYWLVGVPAPLVLGPIVGVLSLVPYAAFIVGAPTAMLLMWLGPPLFDWQTAWWWIVGGPLLVHGISQLLDDYILTPMIQGKSTGMDTPTILFASLAGGVLAGFYGLLVAIPVAACIRILMREVVWPRFRDWAEGKANDPLPISRV